MHGDYVDGNKVGDDDDDDVDGDRDDAFDYYRGDADIDEGGSVGGAADVDGGDVGYDEDAVYEHHEH